MLIELDGSCHDGDIKAVMPSKSFDDLSSTPTAAWYCVSWVISLRLCGHLCEKYHRLSIHKYCCLCAEPEHKEDMFRPCSICRHRRGMVEGEG